jgi:thiol-disulfide isomerase/thioredoxin
MPIRYSFAAALLLAIGCQARNGGSIPGADGAAARTSTLPPADEQVELKILDLAGIEKLIASHHGKVVVMDAWSTSCPPCVKEFPNLVALASKYGPEQLACVSLSFDYEGIDSPAEVAPRVLEFLRAKRATFDNVLSSDDSDALYRKFHLTAVPAVFVYDRAGALRKRFDNEDTRSEADSFTYEQVGQLVAELLNEAPNGENATSVAPDSENNAAENNAADSRQSPAN